VDEQYLQVSVAPYKFIVDAALEVDEKMARPFVRDFVSRHREGVADLGMFCVQLEDEFTERFRFSVACAWKLLDTEHVAITVTGRGTLRRPRRPTEDWK
jgi:hypothetical protein